MLLWTAFMLGLVGSLHCVGMCGPLMLALPSPEGAATRAGRLLLYQGGRISSYVVLGFLLGWLGWGAKLWNAQGVLAWVSGILLVGFALMRVDPGNWLQRLPIFARFQLFLRSGFARLFQRGGAINHYGVGALNGLLPCGLVYVAVIAAANAGDPLLGAAFMGVFGLGTSPLLVASVWLGKGALRKFGLRMPSWAPLIVAAIGVLLIWRAGQVQLPADFDFFQATNFAPMCH
jgi:sulfite exporter TauE/SafE